MIGDNIKNDIGETMKKIIAIALLVSSFSVNANTAAMVAAVTAANASVLASQEAARKQAQQEAQRKAQEETKKFHENNKK